MESIQILLDNEIEYDAALLGSLKEDGRVRVITKHNATDGGQTAVLVTFGVEVNGILENAQTVISMKNFVALSKIMIARYEDNGRPKPYTEPADNIGEGV